jgi:hypothetical protein
MRLLAAALLLPPAGSWLAGAPLAASEKLSSKPAELGPVKAWVEVEPARPRLSDEPQLTLVIDAAEGVKVERPRFGERFAGFRVRDFREPLPRFENGRRIVTQVYRLEPMSSGPHLILPIPITFTDAREGGDGKAHQLETEPLTVEVTSLVEGAPSLRDLAPAEGPVELPRPAARWPLYALGGATLLAAAIAAAVALRRRRRPQRPPTPLELAERELAQLQGANPFGRVDLKGFYVELTLVVRRLVERTTGVRAPEQTTREFLRAIQGHPAFDEARRERLRAFLESADLVKFAAHEPGPDAVEASVARAREFLRLFGAGP